MESPGADGDGVSNSGGVGNGTRDQCLAFHASKACASSDGRTRIPISLSARRPKSMRDEFCGAKTGAGCVWVVTNAFENKKMLMSCKFFLDVGNC